MSFNIVSPILRYRGPVAAAIVAIFAATPAFAVELKFGEIEAHIDTTISASAGMRVAAQNCTHISIYNKGCTDSAGRTADVNNDDGDVNVERGELFSAPIKVVSELDAKYQNYGLFVRGKAYYDPVARNLGDGDGNYGPLANAYLGAPEAPPQRRPLKDALRGDDAYMRQLRGLKLLDAYAYGNFDLGDLPLNVRVGRQAVNWGESTFIQGGISSFLPIDVSALYQPGTELKEVFLPQNTAYMSLGLPNNFTFEAMYIMEWEKSVLPACGSLFGVSDTLGDGCAYGMLRGEYYSNADGSKGPVPLFPFTPEFNSLAVLVHRSPSQEARNSGQWGMATRYYADWLNDGTEMGLYFVNFHSKLPIATFTADTAEGLDVFVLDAYNHNLNSPDCATPAFIDPVGQPITACQAYMGAAAMLSNKTVLAQYPENIHMLGASFNTTIPIIGDGTALSGELAYYSNMPFQVDITELQGVDAVNAGFEAQPGEAPIYTGPMVAPGQVIQGYRRTKAMVGQIYTLSTLTPSNWFVNMTGGDLMALVSNFGFQYLPDADGNRFAIPMSFATHANSGLAAAVGDPCIAAGTCHIQAQYASAFSWGYRLYGFENFDSAFGTAWTLAPKIIWYHDVSGYSAGPIGPGFVEGTKSLTLGIDAKYQSRYNLGLSYTTYMGNPYRNANYDKDFVSLTASYAF
ncbi:DUF1302 family protein [Parvibaculum sedimenti]|uniref:DUF1302 family protein n=1 Tax=Parvibaculum sedimenti TaxID=2608632 RepID=A0A6N6VEF9_9HYPH|nr:DUF1302 domain-containing protein [Parvibaculum sedimenti]KAB7738558.1 DUF1302 family protein [Parvibaculum sedimenti]